MPALPGAAVPDTWTVAAAGRVTAGAPPMSPTARAAVKLLRPAASTVGTRRVPGPAAAREDGDGPRGMRKLVSVAVRLDGGPAAADEEEDGGGSGG